MSPRHVQIIRIVAIFLLVSLALSAGVKAAFGQTLAPVGTTTQTTVYKCYSTPRPGVPRCSIVAGVLPAGGLPVADLDAVLSPSLGGTVDSHGPAGRCYIIGTGPNSVYIACG